jgi:putative endonuclease
MNDRDTRARPSPDARRVLGAQGERRAAAWYRRRGYTVVAMNWRCRNGELDIIVRKGDLLAFCEVKTRRNRRFGHPAEAVTLAKQQRIRSLAVMWLRATGTRAHHLRFDVAAVEGARVEMIEAAF